MNAVRQTTLGDDVTLSGVGVHSGKMASMHLSPGEADSGIVFYRKDTLQSVRACRGAVRGSDLATVLRDSNGPAVSTVEHLLACFAGLGVDNARVEIDGPEVPILDGSAVVDFGGERTLLVPASTTETVRAPGCGLIQTRAPINPTLGVLGMLAGTGAIAAVISASDGKSGTTIFFPVSP